MCHLYLPLVNCLFFSRRVLSVSTVVISVYFFFTTSLNLQCTDGTGSHFVTQRPSDPEIQRPGDPVDPVTLFYNELQMSCEEVFSGQRNDTTYEGRFQV